MNDPGIGAAFYKTAILLLTAFRIKILMRMKYF
jgi:hypothetical protein